MIRQENIVMVFQNAFDCIDVQYDTGILEFVHMALT